MFKSHHKTLCHAAESLGSLLLQHRWRVACAESCTGGGIAQAFTEIPGSSRWFDLGVVTYSNAMKQAHLNVSVATLRQHGAVSEPVAREMALGVLRASGADIAISTSGIAGPDGGSATKPVGTVCFAWGSATGMKSSTERFLGNRTVVRSQAVMFALQKLIEFIGAEAVKNTV